MADAAPSAAFLVIGNEILSGRTREANIQVLAERLRARGIRLVEIRIVPDLLDEVVAAVNALRERHDVVFTSGGIGPTHDDITTQCIAKAFGAKVVRDRNAEQLLTEFYEASGRKATPARLRMADLPEGAEPVYCAATLAPGYQIGNVYTFAGVPFVFESMLDEVYDDLPTGPTIFVRTIAAKVGESAIAEDLGAVQDRHPDLDIGSYPQEGGGSYSVELVCGGNDKISVDAAVREITAKLDGRNLKWKEM